LVGKESGRGRGITVVIEISNGNNDNTSQLKKNQKKITLPSFFLLSFPHTTPPFPSL
jgi:hypothetical protein